MLSRVTGIAIAARQRHDKAGRFAEVDWPDPVDFLADDRLTGVPELRAGHLPDALWPYVSDMSQRMGVDPAGPALAAVGSTSGAVSGEWRVQPKEFDDTWLVPLILWIAILGNPSVMKTPIISAMSKPLDLLEDAARVEHDRAMRDYKTAHHAWKSEGAAPDKEPAYPRLDRYLIEGCTVEALSEALRTDTGAKQRAPLKKIMVRQDELSEWAASFDQYRSGGSGGSDRGAFLRMWNGGPYTIDRVQRGSIRVEEWSGGVMGGIQPGPIQKIAQKSADDGLLQRFAYAVPGAQTKGIDRKPNPEAKKRYHALFPTLAAMKPATDGLGRPRAVTLHEKAHEHRRRIDDLLEVMQAMPDTSDRLKALFAKWPTLFARLALLFHLVDVADARNRGETLDAMILSEDAARRAALYIEQVLLPHALRADAIMFETESSQHARKVALHILAHEPGEITLREIVGTYKQLRGPKMKVELRDIMSSLVTMGWLLPKETKHPLEPPAKWGVNPKVLTTFAARGAQERATRKAMQDIIAEKVRARAKSPVQ